MEARNKEQGPAPSASGSGGTIITYPAAEYVTLVEILERTVSHEEFQEAAQAAVSRLEDEGVRELVTIRFCGEPDSSEVGALPTFRIGGA